MNLAIVARYKRADILTKEWVSGIRRSWLKLMSPSIETWPDVQRAIGQLNQFVSNLQDEVRYSRRGPFAGNSVLPEGKKILDLLSRLRFEIKEALDRATHWQAVQERTGLGGTFNVDDGERMLGLYRTDFAATLRFHVKGRMTAGMTEFLDKILKILREDAQRIKKQPVEDPYEDRSVYREFDIQGMKVVVDDRTVEPQAIKLYIRYLDETYQALKKKGLSKAWYGTVFIKCQDCGGSNPHGTEFGVGGDYRINQDTVQIYSRPTRHIVDLMAHELGHRFWFKQMSGTQRARFGDLIKIKRPDPVPYEERKIKPQDVDAAKKMLSEAYGPTRKLLKDFTASRIKWWPDLLKKYQNTFRETGRLAQHAALLALSKSNSWVRDNPEVQQAHADALADQRKVARAAESLLRDITDMMHSVPEPQSPIEDLDLYWAQTFKPVRERWVQDGLNLIETSIAGGLAYIDISVRAFNEQVKDEIEQKLKEQARQDQHKQVLPVSNYGGSNIDEAWAEVFSHYVLGKDMNRDQLESFKSVLKQASLVSRYKMSRTVVLDQAHVEKLRRDFLTLMKNLPRIHDYKAGAELRQGLTRYRKNFHEFFFERFINPKKEEGIGRFEILRVPGWDLYITLSLPLGYPDNYHGEEALFARFEHEKKSWEQRVKTRAQKFWKVLRDVLDSQDQQKIEIQTPDQDRLVMEGFQVTVRAFNPAQEWAQESLAKFKEVLRLYRGRAGRVLPWILQQQLPLVLSFDSKLDAGGLYKQDKIEISMRALVGEQPAWGVHMLAHEMGHHLFKGLSGQAREFWTLAIFQDHGPLDIQKLLDIWPESIQWSSDFTTKQALKDPVLALQVEVLDRNQGLERREGFQTLLDRGQGTLAVPQNPITGYAGKNPEEAFCEAIGRLVAYGPRAVLPQIKQWLGIVLPGQVRQARSLTDRA